MKTARLYDAEDHITDDGASNGTRTLPTGAILLLVRGMTLHNDVPICQARRPLTFNQDIKGIIAKTGVAPDFLFYWLLSKKPLLLGMVDSAGHGTGRLNTDQLKAMEIGLPPIHEQRAIAHILGTLDDKIELNRRMNVTLEAMARAIFKSWFVDFDPVRAKAARKKSAGMSAETSNLFPDRLVHSEIGEVPEGWGTTPVYDCATYLNGLAFRNDDFSPARSGLPILKIAELKSGIDSQTKYTEERLPDIYRIGRGDLLFSWSGSPDTSIDTFIWADVPGWLNQHIFKATPKAPWGRPSLYILLKCLKPQFIEIARNKQTTGLGHVTVQDLKHLRVALPSATVFNRFDAIMAPVFDRILSILVECRTLAAIRDALLPRLISGVLRVKNAERVVEAGA